MKRSITVLLLGVGFLAASCGDDKKSPATDSVVNTGIDTTNFDKSVRPQDDFFQYVNGGWLKKNPIPASETGWGNFSVLQDKSKKDLKAICEEAAAAKGATGNQQKIGDFYASGMDSAAVEAAKFSPIQDQLDKIAAVKSNAELTPVIAMLHSEQVNAGFNVFVMADMKDSKKNILYINQGGTGLPEKDYYTSPDMKNVQDEYQKHLVNMFKLMGDDEKMAATNGAAVYKFEQALAAASMSAVEQRDQEKQYNKMSTADLAKLTPDFKWDEYWKGLNAPAMTEVIVAQPDFMRQFNKMLKSESVDTWKAYLRLSLVRTMAPMLHSAVADENFHFYGQVLTGAKQQQERWKRVLMITNGALGEALGQLYVEKHFSEESKKRVNEMVDNLMFAYKERIKTREWMSDSTKMAANAKLETILRKLGFPDKWRDYSGLEVTRESYAKNVLASNHFDVNYNLNKLNKPVDRMEWGMTPSTVNAYYNPSNNEIVFPAAIMQPPFFNPAADDAVNYGAMGAVIGHELTHGFDDQGSMFDPEGNMKNWWSEEDHRKFTERTERLASQFDQFVAIDSANLHVNGHLTLGENIADLGGLTIAFHAYKHSLEGKPEPPVIDGLTAEQRFFISWAQGWRNAQRPQALVNQVKTNPHSPAKFRVLGPLSNIPEFYSAFNVKEGDKMYRKPEDRVEIW